ncbi:type VI secretion protein VasK, partial [Pseudomonas sp. MOB-449]|nr:type VI secretion protein VasK [Pseudomonas sp. MOB-449]
MQAIWVRVLLGGAVLTGIVLSLLLWREPALFGLRPGRDAQSTWLLVAAGATSLILLTWVGYRLAGRQFGRSAYRQNEEGDDELAASPAVEPKSSTTIDSTWADLRSYLRERHSIFWRRQVRLLLVVGEPEQIDAIAPGLATQHWLEVQDAVLLWGGSLSATLDDTLPAQLRSLSRRRPLDGIIWALDQGQSADPAAMGACVRHLQTFARKLRWQAPLYLWQVCASEWDQDGRETQPVGCRLPATFTAAELEARLGGLLEPLRQQGLAQLQGNLAHDFLWRLSRDLQQAGIARWRQALAPLLGEFARGVPLRGLWFSLPLKRGLGGLDHAWQADPAWHGVLGDHRASARPLGWNATRSGYALLLGLAALWGSGMLLSYASNRVQIADVQAALATLDAPRDGDASLRALNELVHALDRLDYRAQ